MVPEQEAVGQEKTDEQCVASETFTPATTTSVTTTVATLAAPVATDPTIKTSNTTAGFENTQTVLRRLLKIEK